MPTYTNETVWVVKDTGTGLGFFRPNEPEPRFRIQINGTMQWGDGQTAPKFSLAPTCTTDGRRLLEVNAADGEMCGIVFWDRVHQTHLSLTAENGQLVLRDETGPVELARIG